MITIISSLLFGILFIIWASYVLFKDKPLDILTVSFFVLIALSNTEWEHMRNEIQNDKIKELEEKIELLTKSTPKTLTK